MSYEAYVTIQDYSGTYMGQPISEGDFDRIALRASEELDKLTLNRIRTAGIASYTEPIRDKIKLANCALAESLSIIEGATDKGVVSTSESVGGYSYSIDKTSLSNIMADGIKRAKMYLWGTGLISAVVR